MTRVGRKVGEERLGPLEAGPPIGALDCGPGWRAPAQISVPGKICCDAISTDRRGPSD